MFIKQLYLGVPIIVISMLALAQTSAAPPRKPNIGLFKKMIDHSPFTIKPIIADAVKDSPLARDWTLASISPSEEGFSVTLMNKKDRTNRVRFIPGFSAGDFKLLEVNQDFESRKNSKVHVQKGSQKAWIGYDDLILSPKKPVKKPTTTASKGKVATPPGIINTEKKAKPTRRVRRVPIKK